MLITLAGVATAVTVAVPVAVQAAAPATAPAAASPVAGPAHPDVPVAGAVAAGPRNVRARSAHLVDADTGKVLWGRNADTRRPIGSITKVMTAVVVLGEGGLDRKVRIRPRHVAFATVRNGSTARLRAGDRIPVRELLYAMLLPSGCDATAALADTYGPGRGRFVRKMNRVAQRLGLKRTRYGNASGLPPEPGWSTARDQAVLGRYAMRSPAFRAIVGRSQHVLGRSGQHRRYVWRSTNRLLGAYPGMLGIKTGHTSAAGYSLLFAARREGRTLIGAALDSSKTVGSARFEDATRMLNWGFRRAE